MNKNALIIVVFIATIIVLFVPFMLLFLTASFAEVSIEISKWKPETRSMVAFFGLMFGVMSSIAFNYWLYTIGVWDE